MNKRIRKKKKKQRNEWFKTQLAHTTKEEQQFIDSITSHLMSCGLISVTIVEKDR